MSELAEVELSKEAEEEKELKAAKDNEAELQGLHRGIVHGSALASELLYGICLENGRSRAQTLKKSL